MKDDGSSIGVPDGRLRSLLTWLAVDAGHRVGVEALFDLLWADEPPAPNALQSMVSRLRRVLDSPELLESVAGGYRLRLDRDLVDAHRFGVGEFPNDLGASRLGPFEQDVRRVGDHVRAECAGLEWPLVAGASPSFARRC